MLTDEDNKAQAMMEEWAAATNAVASPPKSGISGYLFGLPTIGSFLTFATYLIRPWSTFAMGRGMGRAGVPNSMILSWITPVVFCAGLLGYMVYPGTLVKFLLLLLTGDSYGRFIGGGGLLTCACLLVAFVGSAIRCAGLMLGVWERARGIALFHVFNVPELGRRNTFDRLFSKHTGR